MAAAVFATEAGHLVHLFERKRKAGEKSLYHRKRPLQFYECLFHGGII